MQNNKKIIDKIYKCLRLSESGNPNEAALALRQASSLMKKHGISDAQVMAAEVNEGTAQAGERYNPPFWALALATLVAEAFECRNLILRQYGKSPEFRFIGLGFKAEVATYSYIVLHRHLSRAIEEFKLSAENNDDTEESRRVEVFAQAWLFRVGRTVTEFISEKTKDSLQKLPLELDVNLEGHSDGTATYFREYVRDFMRKWISKNPKPNGESYNIYRDGLKIYVTLDSRLQHNAEEAMKEHLTNLQQIF